MDWYYEVNKDFQIAFGEYCNTPHKYIHDMRIRTLQRKYNERKREENEKKENGGDEHYE